MAPAKNIGAARILVIVMVATALLPSSSATLTKSGENLFKFVLAGLISSVLDDVIAATPPAKIPEVQAAAEKQVQLAIAKVDTAKGDKAKLDAFMLAYKKVGEQVLATPPAQKFLVMEKGFTEAASSLAP
ncbi:hypothetical protein CFC21_050619 [Triticum aestivum]|uniref:Pollen allergen Poa p IX/Phl p VI domain-containing protein n=2 Tax=Triticum aestivum TaxID=4565 RepID=A0A9R1K4M3_WHEAT|nr:uncharacterized protein OsI_031781-like [Triticum aestivum]KAF7040734.1 hypothetical protein CFC21_050619 [Triticum aestivum]